MIHDESGGFRFGYDGSPQFSHPEDQASMGCELLKRRQDSAGDKLNFERDRGARVNEHITW